MKTNRTAKWFSGLPLMLFFAKGLLACGETPATAMRVDARIDASSTLDANPTDTTVQHDNAVSTDGALAGDTSMASDGTVVSACQGIPNGTGCAAPPGIVDRYVCVNGNCLPSQCGDGALDTSAANGHVPEQCDDGNTQPSDGCEPNCQPTCGGDSMCDDGNICNGRETCGAASANGARTCAAGTNVANGTACGAAGDAGVVDGGTGVGRCTNGLCVQLTNCGNRAVDVGEQCDDGQNGDQTDGCTDACRFTCTTARDCDDRNACTNDSCDTTSHRCVRASILCPRPSNNCILVSCDPARGCVEDARTNDVDGDRYFRMNSTTPGCVGTDCNDNLDTVNPGLSEVCNDSLDNNCDGMVDNGETTWYRDCDGDGVAAMGAPSVVNCTMPAAPSCPSGTLGPSRWTNLAPTTASNQDCNDLDYRAFPGALGYFTTASNGSSPASFDYNCDGQQTQQHAIGGQLPCSGMTPSSCDSRYYYSWTSGANTGCGASLTPTYCRRDYTSPIPPTGPPCVSGTGLPTPMPCR